MPKIKVKRIYQRYGNVTVYVATSRQFPGVVAKADSKERAVVEFMRIVVQRYDSSK